MSDDLSDAIALLSTGSYGVTRGSGGAYVNGVWTPGSTSGLQLQALVTPLSGRDLLRLPEGQRTKQVVEIFTATLLLVGDVLAFQGNSFQVETVEPWNEPGAFYRAIATKVQP